MLNQTLVAMKISKTRSLHPIQLVESYCYKSAPHFQVSDANGSHKRHNI